jgi:hypothetical protein
VGTTYVEASPIGVRNGTLIRVVRPTQLDFEQPMTLKPPVLGVIGIKLFQTLTPMGDSVHVLRRLELTPSGPVALLTPIVTKAFRVENERMMRTLKAFAEGVG